MNVDFVIIPFKDCVKISKVIDLLKINEIKSLKITLFLKNK
ncbi:hypothetical protein A33Q_2283 [Indibacter alkaliphilus LW1]|uniref:Uncharacterized protein n=1 Tax=Indibacter alkaliphilus (strain CCUG 57479 / KCTC 22604 / LW1) TaxID=1189612 RepID=S2E307_INDAL|nr:hypothetical protein A33Q_2283 [Indibacter alkaliphilus LW1]